MATKKDKKARRLSRERKIQRSTQPLSGQQVLLKRARTSKHFKDTKVIASPPGTEKMSEVILRFAEPLKDEYGDVPPHMIRLALLVWNASFLKEDAHKQAIRSIVEIVPATEREVRLEMLLTISMLLERKVKYFSNNKRVIMDYHITISDHRLNLDVVSTVAKDDTPDT